MWSMGVLENVGKCVKKADQTVVVVAACDDDGQLSRSLVHLFPGRTAAKVTAEPKLPHPDPPPARPSASGH